MDVATVVIPILSIESYYVLAWVAAIIIGIITFFGWLDEASKKCICVLLIITLICAGSAIIIRPDHFAEKERILDEALLEAQNIRKEFAEKKFFIREMQQKDVSELEGKMDGVFLFIAGTIYGEIKGTEIKKITLVYKENGTQRHYVKTFLMEGFPIITIGKDDTPYFAYSDAYYVKEKLSQITYFKVKSGKPVLYLPYGWEILNNLQRYPQ